MQLHDELVGDCFRRNFQDDGSTIGGHYDEYFGLIAKWRANMPELYGYIVTMDGSVVVPELRPTASASNALSTNQSSEQIMNPLDNDTIVPANDEYIGDDLTWEDLQRGYAAFLEDSSAMTA